MKVYDLIKGVISQQLFAVAPKKYEDIFKARLYFNNTSRFATQCFFVVLMDFASLLFYMVMYAAMGSFNMQHILVHIIKIGAMILFGVYLSSKSNQQFRENSLLDRNMDICYEATHFIFELFLFISGPQGLGALIRLLAVPFIVAGIPVIIQYRALLLQVVIYLVYFFYIPVKTKYGLSANSYSMFLNTWVITFPCSILLSFTVYSSFVNNFAARMKEKEAKDALSELNAQLDRLSKRDPLTGLFNRRGFQQYMDETWAESAKANTSFTVMMIDIDYFKRYNDTFGHGEGDLCLQSVTKAISDVLADKDSLLARYGGEEFIAVIYGQDHQEIVEVADHMRQKVLDLKLAHSASEVNTFVTISVGIATEYTSALENYTELINWADECLYFAKRTGRNRIVHTQHKRGDYRDIYGVPLLSGQSDSKMSREFDDEYTQRILSDVGANCSFVYDSKSKNLFFTKQAIELFGLKSTLKGPYIKDLAASMSIAEGDQSRFINIVINGIAHQEPYFSIEVCIERENGELVPVSIDGECHYGEDGRLSLAYGAIVSISKLVEYSHFLVQQSMTDMVTLLPNKNKLDQTMKHILAHKERYGYVILLDIKDFKGINSFYSHSAGDQVLREIARRLTKLAASYMPVYNYGVDQFAIVAGEADRDTAEKLMQEIHQYFHNRTDLIEGLAIHIEFSIVAVEYVGGVSGLDQLFLDMDAATQMIKYEQGSQYAFFDGQIKATSMEQIKLGNKLRKAIENNFEGFMLYYQPIINPGNKAWVGAEALLRWKDDNDEIVSPAQVIPILEQSDLMVPVENWVIRTACAQCRKWIDEGASRDFFININLFAAKLGRASLQEDIVGIIEKNGLSLNNLVLEITESSAVASSKSAWDTLSNLNAQGLRIAIDDFGTGYSSFSYLRKLPVSQIKIDRSFVKDIETSGSAEELLRSMITMVKSMGFIVCVEGIEKEGQYDFLKRERIDCLQGFLFGKPYPAELFYDNYALQKSN